MKTRILIVDDEPAITRMVKRNLESTENYEVLTQNDSKKAIKSARSFFPDLILLDVMMPDMDGDEIANLLKEDKQLSKIKLIFMTAIVSKSDIASRGTNVIGGHVFLAKPVKIETLIEAIETVLKQN